MVVKDVVYYNDLAKVMAIRANLQPGLTRCGPECLGAVLRAYDEHLALCQKQYSLIPVRIQKLKAKDIKLRYKSLDVELQTFDKSKIMIAKVQRPDMTELEFKKIQEALSEFAKKQGCEILAYNGLEIQIDLMELVEDLLTPTSDNRTPIEGNT